MAHGGVETRRLQRGIGSDQRCFYAVLHLGGIRSPLDAMRAAIYDACRVSSAAERAAP
jgi:hypothetical protein